MWPCDVRVREQGAHCLSCPRSADQSAIGGISASPARAAVVWEQSSPELWSLPNLNAIEARPLERARGSGRITNLFGRRKFEFVTLLCLDETGAGKLQSRDATDIPRIFERNLPQLGSLRSAVILILSRRISARTTAEMVRSKLSSHRKGLVKNCVSDVARNKVVNM